jgi:hypothetical protein
MHRPHLSLPLLSLLLLPLLLFCCCVCAGAVQECDVYSVGCGRAGEAAATLVSVQEGADGGAGLGQP